MVVDLVLDALAVHRLTRLVTADVLTADLRNRIVEAAYVADERAEQMREQFDAGNNSDWSALVELDWQPPKIASLVTCRWCTGVYIAAAVVAARRLVPRPWGVAARALALSSAAALIAGLED